MQPNDSFNVSRRALDVEDYIDILRRHKGWIFGPFLLCVVASVVGVFLWPDSYLSEAKVRIIPQQVPESMVPSTINQLMTDRILSMQQEILSRNVLTSIIQNKNLYPKDRIRLPMDDVVENLMRKSIQISMLVPPNSTNRVIPAFAIQFSYENRYLAQQVVADLMSRFIDSSTRNNSNRTHENTQFFKDEADAAKKELDLAETQLTEFQAKNNGHLPDQADSNMRSLLTLESELTGLNGNLSRANSDRLQLESSIRILQDQQREISKQVNQPTTTTATVASMQRSERLAEAERDVERIEDGLRMLRSKYGEAHPDVQNAVGMLKVAQTKRDEAIKDDVAKREEAKKEQEEAKKEQDVKKDAKTETAAANPAAFRDKLERDSKISAFQAMIEAKDLDIAELNRDIKRTNDEIKKFQGLLDVGPLGAKQYTDLLRDREIARVKYIQADDQLSKSQRSQNMESRNQGERLEALDTATLPTDPTEPKRPIVIAVGAGLGLLLGIVIAGAREMQDTALKNLKDVRAYTQMAVLGSIPLLENDFVVKRRRRLAWLGWTTVCLVAVVVMAGATVYYYSTRGGTQ